MSEVKCPRCSRFNPPGHEFCTACGTNLQMTDNAERERERQSLASELQSARQQLDRVSDELDRLQGRIDRLEGGPSTPSRPPAQEVQAPVAPQSPAHRPEARPSDDTQREGTTAPATPPYRRPQGTTSTTPATLNRETIVGERPAGYSSRSAEAMPAFGGGWGHLGSYIDWEQALGRNWFAIIGAVALVLGLGFFLKLSFDNNWIGDTGRIALGIVVGTALLATGEYAQRRVPFWAQAVTAGGAAILYLSIYSSYALYELIRPDAALMFLATVVGLAGLLAIRYGSMVIGILGVIGAFIAPVLLGPELPDIRLVLPYILVIDLGILGVATFRNWRWFILMGWIGSYGLFAAGISQFPDYEPVLMQVGLTAMFLIFVGATTLFHILWRRVPGPLDMSLVAINATAFFALTTTILWEEYQAWFGLISLSLSLLYGLIAFAAIRRSGAPSETALIALPMALVFLTLAVPLQFSGVWLTTAWATQGAALIWSGFLLRKKSMRSFGLGALALATIHLLLFGTFADIDAFRPVLNERSPIFVAVIAALYVAGYLFWRNRDLGQEWERLMTPILATAANGLTLLLLSMEAMDFFGIRFTGYGNQQDAINGALLALTVIWSAYASILIGVGLKWRLALARWGGMGLIAVAILKLLVLDTFAVQLDPLTFVPVLNPHFLTYIVVLAPMAVVYYWSWRARSDLPLMEVDALRVLLVALNVVALWGLSQEAIHYFDSRALRPGDQNAINGVFLSLTAIWSIYASLLIAIGLKWRLTLVRWGGLALIAVAVLKLLLLDTFEVILDPSTFIPVLNAHFVTFLVVLSPLAAIAYFFRREIALLSDRESSAFRVLLIAINVVALWGMSLEAVHYFDSRDARIPGLSFDQNATNGMYLALTAIWSVYASILLAVGLRWGMPRVRVGGMALMAAAMIKLLLVDTFAVKLDPYTFVPVLNPHFLTFVLILALMIVLAFAFRRERAELPDGESDAFRALLTALNAIALWALTQETIHYFDSREQRLGLDQDSAKHLTLTVQWAVYGIAAIGVGIVRQSSNVRLAGMALLAIPVIKLFGFDVFLLERGYRVAAFVTLGVLLLGTGLAYQRYSQAVRGFLFGEKE